MKSRIFFLLIIVLLLSGCSTPPAAQPNGTPVVEIVETNTPVVTDTVLATSTVIFPTTIPSLTKVPTRTATFTPTIEPTCEKVLSYWNEIPEGQYIVIDDNQNGLLAISFDGDGNYKLTDYNSFSISSKSSFLIEASSDCDYSQKDSFRIIDLIQNKEIEIAKDDCSFITMSNDGKLFSYVCMHRDNMQGIVVGNIETGETKSFFEYDEQILQNWNFSPDNKWLPFFYRELYAPFDKAGLYFVDLSCFGSDIHCSNSVLGPFSHETFDLGVHSWSPNSEKFAGIWGYDDPIIRIFDITTERISKEIPIEYEINHMIWGFTENQIFFSTTENTQHYDIYLLNIETGEYEKLFTAFKGDLSFVFEK